MIYPENFEQKIGFDEVRTLLRGRCISSLGAEWADRVTFMPVYADVKRALEEADEFRRFTETEEDVYEENFFDVRQALARVRPERTHMEEPELFDLARSLHTVEQLTAFLNRPVDAEAPVPTWKYPALHALADGVCAFPDIIARISGVLNKYGKMKDTASPELLSIRHSIELAVRSVSHSLRSIISEAQHEGYIERDVAPTLRDGRLVIPVAPALKKKIKGIIHDESASGKTVFIEPAAVVEANNRIRELRAAERREVIRILQELSAVIRPHVGEMMDALLFLGHIDYLRALTSFSSTFSAIVPRLESGPAMDWQEARHPLLEQSLARHGDKMVPLNLRLDERHRILLISGPNAGGKSVCLKTAGLLQYMLQCGMPIPVREGSTAGVFDGIFIDIGDEQSLENDLSTYSSHLLGMKIMMKNSGRRSLLLIDEFGSGTEPLIGGALAEAILDRFVKNAAFGIITTHYQNLKRYAETHDSVVNAAMLYDRAQMRPLFMLQIGNPGSSFAVEIARKIGIPEDVIAYASELVGKDYIMSDKYLQDIVRDKMYWENKRRNIHKREKQLEELVARYETEMQKLLTERKEVMARARSEAEHLLQASNAKIENTIRTIREAQAERERTRQARRELEEFKDDVAAASAAGDEARIERKMEQIKRRRERREERRAGRAGVPSTTQVAEGGQGKAGRPAERPLAPGDTVRIKGQTAVGTIDSIGGHSARVLFGMMYTSLPIDRLERAAAPREDKTAKAATFVSKATRDAMYEKKLHFRPEIDVRGMRAEEALTAVTYFIDDAIQLEHPRVRILHGTGTGALREAIRSYLATVPGVARFHDEHVQFGGAGITVVELS